MLPPAATCSQRPGPETGSNLSHRSFRSSSRIQQAPPAGCEGTNQAFDTLAIQDASSWFYPLGLQHGWRHAPGQGVFVDRGRQNTGWFFVPFLSTQTRYPLNMPLLYLSLQAHTCVCIPVKQATPTTSDTMLPPVTLGCYL